MKKRLEERVGWGEVGWSGKRSTVEWNGLVLNGVQSGVPKSIMG